MVLDRKPIGGTQEHSYNSSNHLSNHRKVQGLLAGEVNNACKQHNPDLHGNRRYERRGSGFAGGEPDDQGAPVLGRIDIAETVELPLRDLAADQAAADCCYRENYPPFVQ